MSLREEVELYSKLTGKDGTQEPIVRIGAYLDGYEKGKEDAEPHWIPCSEGLPKEEGFYLVTLGYKHGAETNIRYFKIENGKRYWSLWGNENITAWMPKPIPYQTKIEVTE